MKNLIVRVKNKEEVNRMSEFCKIIFVSKFINSIAILIEEDKISLLEQDVNVLEYREESQGQYQHNIVYC